MQYGTNNMQLKSLGGAWLKILVKLWLFKESKFPVDRTWLKSPWMDPNDDLSSAYNLKLENNVYLKNIFWQNIRNMFKLKFKFKGNSQNCLCQLYFYWPI